jgi:DNA-binding LytR/AlgR family response regulator
MQETPYFMLPNRHRKSEKIPYSEILYLEASVNYTLIHLQGGKVKVSPKTLLFHVNNSLNESFIRIHRTFCVNRNYIQNYDEKNEANILQLMGGIELAVSRRKKRFLLKN